MQAKDTHNVHSFWAVGINYKKTDASLRGQFAIGNEQYEQLLTTATTHGLKEFFVISTCNRTEIYGLASGPQQLINFVCSVTAGDQATFEQICYLKNGREAIEHLFQVAAGLDSQILGDYEILGQIKNAAKQAKNAGYIGSFMERLLNSVLQSSKAIKTHTALSGGTVSVAFAAVQYIREFFEGPEMTPHMQCPSSAHLLTQPAVDHYVNGNSLEGKKIVLLGTGKIGRSACRNLVDYINSRDITLINRTAETASALASELGLKCASMDELDAELASADIILVSTSAPQPLIKAHHLAGKGNKLVIDFSIPCNVAEDARQLPGITFVDVDLLSKIKDETLQQRQGEVPKAVVIIEEMVGDFLDWNDMRRHVPVLKAVKSKLKEMSSVPAGEMGDDDEDSDERIQKVINALAIRIRKDNTWGCQYIRAINDYIA